jgi:copper chaperone
MTTATVPVAGMTCMGCVNSVTKALNAVPGVNKVEVSLESNQATVTFDESKTNVDAVKTAIEDAGFEAQ